VSDHQNLLTLRDIANTSGVRIHVAKYAISEYDITPVQRAGIVRLWSREQLPTIQAAIKRIGSRREAVNG
jgi:hypothetical protein